MIVKTNNVCILHVWLVIIVMNFRMVYVVFDNPSKICSLGASLQVFTIVFEVPDESSEDHRRRNAGPNIHKRL